MNKSAHRDMKGHFFVSALSTLATPWLIFVASTLPLYLANQEELRYQNSVMWPFLFAGATLWIMATVVLLLVRNTASGRLVIWAYYIAGPTFLGLISLTEPASGGPLVLGLVLIGTIIIFLGAFLLAKYVALHQAVVPIAIACCAFVAIDVLSVTSSYQRPAAIENQQTHLSGSGASELPNIYHVIFDEYQTDLFDVALNLETEQSLAGFTYFTENTTPFGRTGMALPTILTGNKFDFQSPQVVFQKSAFNDSNSLLFHLKQMGYTTEAYVHPVYNFPLSLFDRTTTHKSQLPYGNKRLEETFFELWIYANFPSSIAKPILGEELLNQYVNQNVLIPVAPIISRDSFRSVMAYERDLDSTGRYVFVHLILPHFPSVLNSQCGYDSSGAKSSALEQSQCANRLMTELVLTLKSLNRFENSLIIFQSDHGSRYRVNNGKLQGVNLGHYSNEWSRARSRALLLIKPPVSAESRLTRSKAPSTLLDIAPTIMSLLKLPPKKSDGFDLFTAQIPADRARFYHFFEKKGKNGWTDKMVRYQIFEDRVEKIGEIILENNPKP